MNIPTIEDLQDYISKIVFRNVPVEAARSYVEMPMKSQLVGLATFSHITGNESLTDKFLELAEYF